MGAMQRSVASKATLDPDSIGYVPSPKGEIPPEDQGRLRAVLDARASADKAVKDAVLSAVDHGASVRELASFTGLSTNTISRWKRGE